MTVSLEEKTRMEMENPQSAPTRADQDDVTEGEVAPLGRDHPQAQAFPSVIQQSRTSPRDVLDSASYTHEGTAFAVAAADPILKEAGLTSRNVGEAMRFFELSQGMQREPQKNRQKKYPGEMPG